MKITKSNLQNLIKEEAVKQIKAVKLEEKKAILNKKLDEIWPFSKKEEKEKPTYTIQERPFKNITDKLGYISFDDDNYNDYYYFTIPLGGDFGGDPPYRGKIFKDTEETILDVISNDGKVVKKYKIEGKSIEEKLEKIVKFVKEKEEEKKRTYKEKEREYHETLEEKSNLNEEAGIISTQMPATETKKRESIFDSKPGQIVILNFDGITIKLQRQLDDLFKVVDAAESHKLKTGDYLRAQGNDTLEQGRKIKFAILREIPVSYESKPILSWNIIKN